MPRPTFAMGDTLTAENLDGAFEYVEDRIDAEAALSRQFSVDMEALNLASLQFPVLGGNIPGETAPDPVAAASLTLTGSATNYVELDLGTGTLSANTSGWTAGRYHLYQVVTATSSIVDYDDMRGNGGAGGGGITEVTGSDGVTVTDGTEISLTDGGVTDAKIGNRTIDDSLATPVDTGTLTQLLSWLGGRIKAITGEGNWHDTPSIALTDAEAHMIADAPHNGHFDLDGSKAMEGASDYGGWPIQNLGLGTGPDRAVIGSELDGVASGYKDLENVKAMATANLTLSGAQTIDAVSCVALDRVLLTGQTTTSENGPWIVQAGAWTRPADFDTGDTPDAGTRIFAVNGAAKKGTSWTLLTAGAVIDTDPLLWTQTGAAGTGEANTASNVGTGTGLIFKAKAGLDLVFKSIKTASSRLAITNNADDITLDVVEAQLDRNALGGGALDVANGGTGLTTVAEGSLLYASADDVLSALAPNGSGTPKFLRQSDEEAPSWQPITVAGYSTTSTTTVAFSTGAKVFTVAAGLGYTAGQRVRAVRNPGVTDYVEGLIGTYVGTALTVTVDRFNGSGSASNWIINLAADAPSPDGNQSANTVKAGPVSGAAAAPAYRALVVDDIPILTLAKISDAGTAAAVADSSLVHLAGAETITGRKTLATDLLLTEIATPATPSATHHAVYPKADGKLYHLNSAGTEVEIGSGSGSSVGSDLYLYNNFI